MPLSQCLCPNACVTSNSTRTAQAPAEPSVSLQVQGLCGFCGTTTKYRCARCGVAFFCSRAHQRLAWPRLKPKTRELVYELRRTLVVLASDMRTRKQPPLSFESGQLVFIPEVLYNALPTRFNQNTQEDAGELLQYLVGALGDYQRDRASASLFSGLVEMRTLCLSCQNTRCRDDPSPISY